MKPEYEKIQNRPFHSFIAKIVERPKRPTLKEAWHFHPEVEVCFTLKSKGKRFVGNNIAEYQSGDLVMFGSNLPHGFITEQESRQVVIQMQEDFLGDQFLEKPETQVIKELFIRANRGLQFTGATQESARNKIELIMKSEGLPKILSLLDLLYALAISEEYCFITPDGFQSNTKLVELERVQIVYDYILQNYQDQVSLDEAAQLISLTKSSFCKFLKKHVKKTFSELVNDIRITHACELLSQTDKNISTVAYESGFSDVSYFSRTFKKIIKSSPKVFMEKYR